VESVPGQILGQLGKLGGYLGSPQAAQDYTSLLQGKLPAGARAAEAAGPPEPARLANQFGPPVPPGLPNRLGATPAPSSSGTTPIVQAADDTYKQLLSQYGGAPGIQQLANMPALTTGFTPQGASQPATLKDYYNAQRLQGSANLGTIINAMGYTGDMAKWAQANPALAQEQYAKRFGNAIPGVNPMAGFNMSQQLAGNVPGPYEGTPAGDVFASSKPIVNPATGFGLTQQLASSVSPQTNFSYAFGQENFGSPANVAPAPPAETQASLNTPFNQAMAVARSKQNTQNMPTSFSDFWNPSGQQ
jgi:hypothetical protein